MKLSKVNLILYTALAFIMIFVSFLIDDDIPSLLAFIISLQLLNAAMSIEIMENQRDGN